MLINALVSSVLLNNPCLWGQVEERGPDLKGIFVERELFQAEGQAGSRCHTADRNLPEGGHEKTYHINEKFREIIIFFYYGQIVSSLRDSTL